jgi:hypothetical protein
MILELKGKKYESEPVQSSVISCVGCAFISDNVCPNTDKSGDHRCAIHDIVWKEIKLVDDSTKVLSEPKYTVGEVLRARYSVLGTTPETPTQVGEIAQYLKLQSDPEYKLYLELKEKFRLTDTSL